MLTLGIIDSKPSTAAVLRDDTLVAAVAEERLCRMKMASGMPRQAIAAALDLAGVAAGELDAVAVAGRVSVFEPEPVPWTDWFDIGSQQDRTVRFDRLGAALAPHLGRLPLALAAHHRIKRWVYRERSRELPRLLAEAYGIEAPVRFFDHHFCHATGAYHTSGFDRALVVTLDGGGDGLSGSVWAGEGGALRRLATVDSFHSIGNFYSYVTNLCGFKAERHEGKVTGLAALGRPVHAEVLRRFVAYREPGRIRYGVPMYHESALRLLRDALPADFDRADLAASAQWVLEEVVRDFVAYWIRRSGMRRLALAGGVFANVKLNQRLHALDAVEAISIHPAMDDSGLAAGAAIAAEVASPGGAGFGRRLPHVYLGPDYSDGGVESLLAGAGFAFRRAKDVHGEIARLLARGHVVARFHGRMEYGPRALGNRTILYRTTDPSVNDWLNERLRRTEFMPFGPATLAEEAGRCYHGIAGAEDPARFMTITFDCTEEMKAASPGVVHADGTARPQLVDRETAPDFHGILTAYRRLTGNPSLINTSFNIHEEPIVCTPRDALRAFEQGGLDYLAIHDWVVAHPSVSRRERSVASGRPTAS